MVESSSKLQVRWDNTHDEPYLTLSAFPDLRITLIRAGDEDNLVKLQNIPSIGMRAFSRPYPWPADQAPKWVNDAQTKTRPLIEKMRPFFSDTEASKPNPEETFGFPWQVIRDNSNTNAPNQIIGTIDMMPFEWNDRNLSIPDLLALPPEEQIWGVGYVLHPDYRQRGIMFGLVDALLEEWVRPFMRIGQVTAGVETNNIAGTKLVEKLGFQRTAVIQVPYYAGDMRELGDFIKDMYPKV